MISFDLVQEDIHPGDETLVSHRFDGAGSKELYGLIPSGLPDSRRPTFAPTPPRSRQIHSRSAHSNASPPPVFYAVRLVYTRSHDCSAGGRPGVQTFAFSGSKRGRGKRRTVGEQESGGVLEKDLRAL